jgi:hypothetical protein
VPSGSRFICWLQKLCVLALLGFVALVLSGPIIVLLFFACIGLAAYIVIRVVRRGKEPAKKAARNLAIGTGKLFYGTGHWTLSQVKRGTDSVALRFKPKSGAASPEKLRGSRLLYTGRVLLETISGGAVAVLLVGALSAYGGRPPGETKEAIFIGALIGCMVGFVLGASRKNLIPPSSPENA